MELIAAGHEHALVGVSGRSHCPQSRAIAEPEHLYGHKKRAPRRRSLQIWALDPNQGHLRTANRTLSTGELAERVCAVLACEHEQHLSIPENVT